MSLWTVKRGIYFSKTRLKKLPFRGAPTMYLLHLITLNPSNGQFSLQSKPGETERPAISEFVILWTGKCFWPVTSTTVLTTIRSK